MLQTKMLDYARAVLGDDIILHHSKLFQKPAEQGAPFPMHQDWPYFPSRMDKVIAGIIHVSEATDEMGCLRVWPKSHKLGRIEAAHGRETGVLDQYPIEDAIAIMPSLEMLSFHYLSLHDSIRIALRRHKMVVQMYAGEERNQKVYMVIILMSKLSSAAIIIPSHETQQTRQKTSYYLTLFTSFADFIVRL